MQPVRVMTSACLGVVPGAVAVVLLAVGGLALLPVAAWPRARDAVLRRLTTAATHVADLDRHRLTLVGVRPEGARRPVAYLGVLALLALPGGLLVATALVAGGGYFASLVMWLLVLHAIALSHVLFGAAVGVAGVYLAWQFAEGLAVVSRTASVRLLGPDPLQERITELTASRAEVVDAVDAERRRIERDLHDGVQQRLVGLGVLLGRARRATDAVHAADLARQAHEESQRLIDDLRELVWRVYPAALDDGDLTAALEPLVDRSPIPVTLRCDPGRPARAVVTAAYFVISEAVTNVAKHATASHVHVFVRPLGVSGLVVHVHDDGAGGARIVPGGGLDGLARRVAALDGHLRVLSPDGGPTIVSAELPGSVA